MKRSEMLKVLKDAIFEDIICYDWSPLEDEGNLSRVLDRIEKSGMLPPTIRIPAFGVTDNAWEPEDE